MKIITVIILTLFMSIALAMDASETSSESNIYDTQLSEDAKTIEEENRWLIGLSRHLLKQHNINMNIMALSHLNSLSADELSIQMDTPVLDSETKLAVLNKAIESPDASSPTLLTARSICQEQDMLKKCDLDRLNQKIFHQDPENLNIYLFELEQAVNDSDIDTIDIVLQQMSQAEYSHMFDPFSVELGEAIDKYTLDNPVDNEIVQSFKQLELSQSEFDADALMKQSALMAYLAVGYMNMPALRPLSRACQEFQKDLSYCYKIANIMIDHSDTSLMTMLGYGLIEKFDEINGDAKSLIESQAASEEFKDYQRCIVQNHALGNNPLDMFDSKLLAIMTQGNHEGANLERAALYLFDKYKDRDETVIDPRTCGLRYIEVMDKS